MLATFGLTWWMGFFTGLIFALCLLVFVAMLVEQKMKGHGRKDWKRFDPKDDDEEEDGQ